MESPQDLGLIFTKPLVIPENILKPSQNVKYYIWFIDSTIPSVSIKASFSYGPNNNIVTDTTFFTTKNFNVTYDLNDFQNTINPLIDDGQLRPLFQNAAEVNESTIQLGIVNVFQLI